MKRYVGETLVFRELERSGPVQNCPSDHYEVFEEQYIGADPKTPKQAGRYIEVKVTRNFRVTQVAAYKVEELD